MSRGKSLLIGGIFCLAFSLIVFGTAVGQMTIFNVPSTDTLPRSSLYFEADFIAKPVSYRNGGYQTYGYRVVYGLGHKTEIGTNFYYIRDGGDAVGELQFNIKRTIYRNEKRGFASTAGVLVSLPLRNTRGDRSWTMAYANVSKTFARVNGLRVTAGAYSIFGGEDFGAKNGAIVGIEQPIKGKFSFIADWSSGNNRLGYLSAGLNYAISKRSFILIGGNFGNSGHGNNSISAYYGYTF